MLSILLLFLLCFPVSFAQPMRLERAFPLLTFELPVGIEHAPGRDDRLFVVCQRGRIFTFANRPDVDTATLFLDLTDRIPGTGNFGLLGLLGLAFDPDFENNGELYCYYAERGKSTLARYRIDPQNRDFVPASSEEIIITIAQTQEVEHVGGQIAFGPDGYLYIALGDGGRSGDPLGSAQDQTSLLGKILRIDVHDTSSGRAYAIPADNPFVGGTGIREEIYAYGFRNPWRFSFDAPTGRLWAGDVGEGNWEEIDLVTSGGNYGWPIMEGPECFRAEECDTTGLVMPIWSYAHSGDDSVSGNTIIGGFVYRGEKFPDLSGQYIYGDIGSSNIRALDYRVDGGSSSHLIASSDVVISSFGRDLQGEIYVCGYLPGSIHRLVGSAAAVSSGSEGGEGTIVQSRIWPLPAREDLMIEYTLSRRSHVSLSIVDSRGAEVLSLVDGMREAGVHREAVIAFQLFHGVGYYLLTAGGERRVGKVMVW